MDELQISFINNKLFLWGISSDVEEVFTPIERLTGIYKEIFLTDKFSIKNNEIEIETVGEEIIVPKSMKLFYNQFIIKNISLKSFIVKGIEIDENIISKNFLIQENKHNIIFGDSYEFFNICLKFAFSIVSRERFVPFYHNNSAKFIINLDNQDDHYIFTELIKKAPLSIKPGISNSIESILRDIMNYFINLIILNSFNEINFDINKETNTDEWLSGLLGKSTSKISNSIKEGLNQWLIIRKVNREFNYNLLFKIQEPSEKNSSWNLSFYIQSKKDPSLIINLGEVWRNTKKIEIKDIKIHLLSDLGIASKFSKSIEKALYKPNPESITLTEEETLNFIANDSFILKDAGFSVQIPKIINTNINPLKVKVKFRDNSNLIVKGTGTLGQALFDFDYSVAIGDIELTKDEFYRLSKNKEKLVNIKGKWVEINQEDLKKIISYFENKKNLSISDTFKINALNENNFEILDVILPRKFNDKINGLFNLNNIEHITIPETFSGELRKYQIKGVSWMNLLRNIGFGGILADDMGLGKTVQTIAYLLSISDKPSLVVCPTSVLGNWQKELEKFSPKIKLYMHHGNERLNKNQFLKEIQDKDLIISSYATVRRDEEIFLSLDWANLLLDEAQNIKNPYAKQTISINKIRSKNRFCLTGTPIENRLSELWSLMNFVNPGFLSNWNDFKKKFAEPIELENNNEKIDLLKKIISPFILRRLKTDKSIINDLPDKTEIKEYCFLTEEQASLYQAIVNSSLKEIESSGENRRALIMATLIKLKQLCNHPSNYLKDRTDKLSDRSGKVNRLRELLETILENKEKCLIFTQYKEMGDLLKTDLENYFSTPICFLHGQMDRKKRQQLIDYFQSDDINSPKMFILSLKAGGIGINLTKANHVIHFDRWWNPSVENQATDRAFRIGQQKNVFVYKFITTGTIEENIDLIIDRKLNLSDSLLKKGELAITEMNNEELRKLFTLRKEVLGE